MDTIDRFFPTPKNLERERMDREIRGSIKSKSKKPSSDKPKKPSSDKKPVGLNINPASSQRYLPGGDNNSDEFSEIIERAAPRSSFVILNEPLRLQSSKLEGLSVVSPYEAPSRIQSVLKLEDVAARPSSSLDSADIRLW